MGRLRSANGVLLLPGELDADDVPPPSEIWKALERLKRSRTLSRAEKLVALLHYLVETTVSGNAYYLKETTIGVSVFGRVPDYDPKADAIVRSQAWRLRTKLGEYYATEGLDDPILIEIPKGQYVATLHWRRKEVAEVSPTPPQC